MPTTPDTPTNVSLSDSLYRVSLVSARILDFFQLAMSRISAGKIYRVAWKKFYGLGVVINSGKVFFE